MVVVSTRSDKKLYHELYCPYADRIQKRYRKTLKTVEIAKERGYSECSWCGGLHGEFLQTEIHPNLYGRVRKAISFSFDRIDKALCMKTRNGFWKVIKSPYDGMYKLYHLNHGDFDYRIDPKVLMRRTFHRQKDVKPGSHVAKFVSYVYEHDKAKTIIDNDWRKLPQKTQKQKRYYKQAEKRANRNKRKRLYEIFDKIEKGEI